MNEFEVEIPFSSYENNSFLYNSIRSVTVLGGMLSKTNGPELPVLRRYRINFNLRFATYKIALHLFSLWLLFLNRNIPMRFTICFTICFTVCFTAYQAFAYTPGVRTSYGSYMKLTASEHNG